MADLPGSSSGTKRSGSDEGGGGKRPRTWTTTLEYQNRYNFRRYSISDATIDLLTEDDAYIPFPVSRSKEHVEMHVAVCDRVISAIEEIEVFAKEEALANLWLGRSMPREEIDAMFSSSLKRNEHYATKLKCYVGVSSIVSLTSDGHTSAGRGVDDDQIKDNCGLKGFAVSGKLRPLVWTKASAIGVQFYFDSVVIERRRRSDSNRLEDVGLIFRAWMNIST